ncbi:MAG TPA: UDP-N-acetylmuramate dehydrogenase [Candidatus Paceibacterota bacterium]|jgi:UDP-N-acetylmuramate dehydrogenase|nr:UDP-N-acetylmuramate dehydrogenase [Candidatus Paceibacterota bacterium]
MPRFQENVPLCTWSNYKIGGPARFFFAPKNEREVHWAITEAKKKKLPVFILGGGTNLLIGDEGFDGLVIRPTAAALHARGTKVAAGTGVTMEKLLDFSAGKSLSGLEWAGGLPGTLGGAIRGNAGCFGGEIKDVVASVKSFDPKKMRMVTRSTRACAFGYRTSIFKKGAKGEIILEATLALRPGKKSEIQKATREKMEYRKKNHPLDYPNIGSIFKNVPLATLHKASGPEYKKALREATLVFRGSHFSVKTDPFPVISTAKLIAESGLRGVSFGGAMFSAKHPNFIVNVLNANAGDVKGLILLAKSAVKDKFDVELEEEVQIT